MTDNGAVIRTLVVLALTLSACAPHRLVEDTHLDDPAVRRVLRDVVRARNLPLRHALPVELVEKDFVRERYWNEATSYVSMATIDSYSVLLRKLRLVPGDFELKKYADEALRKNIGGFYDPKSGVMRLVHQTGKPWMIIDLAERFFQRDVGGEFLLAHELGHALVDQNFDLQHYAGSPTQADTLVAEAAFVEGDAQLTAFAYLAGRPLKPAAYEPDAHLLYGGPIDQWRSVPAVFRRPAVFLYLDGMCFAAAVYERGGTRALNAVYKDPPRSTEEILHPEKYFGHTDPPVQVRFDRDPPAMAGFEVVNENTLGEIGVQTLLAVPLGWFAAAKAADGWGGDRFRIYRDPKNPATVGFAWRTVWDSPAERVEFVENLAHALDVTFGKGAALGQTRVWLSADTTFVLNDEGDRGALLTMTGTK